MIKYKKLIYHLYFYVLVIVFTPNLILGDICAQSLSSDYIVTKDGTKLAADIYKPDNHSNSKYPALLIITRYRRGIQDGKTGEIISTLSPLDKHFLSNDYVLVKVDARGSGASFGTRPTEYGKKEVLDGYDIVEWVISQNWSDGNVGAYGTSYTGTTAELLAAVNHSAVKAVIPGWSDFDIYSSPVRPYGAIATGFIKQWGERVGDFDNNNVKKLGVSVRPVNKDKILFESAISEHASNPNVFQKALAAEYRDDEISGGETWADIGPIYWRNEIGKSNIPMLVFASWLDAGTADGALLRFQNFNNPQNLILMASTHGGAYHASPYTVSDTPLSPQPSELDQFELRRNFFDYHLKGKLNEVSDWAPIRFFNLGEEKYHTSNQWPPADFTYQNFYMDKGNSLVSQKTVELGIDEYIVDDKVSTGVYNRWFAQMGKPILELDDRQEMDNRMLIYTTEPLNKDLQITGYPIIEINLSINHDDGMIFVYLEDVDPNGKSRYLTEGGIRMIHRKITPNPYFVNDLPYHSYNRSDAELISPGEVTNLSFYMWPISVLIRKGHRIRLAIAGADADTFTPISNNSGQVIKMHRGGSISSHVKLPVIIGELK
jgi:hypothetical protein